MNILVFTSSMPDYMFSSYQDEAIIKPNPSNQNFYSKLIRSLSLLNNVSVVSHRPFVKGMFKNTNVLGSDFAIEENVKYYFTNVRGDKIYKLIEECKNIIKAAESAIEDFVSDDFIIITDTLRPNLLKAAKIVAKRHNVKVIGVLTDNPTNLSSGRPLIKKFIKKQAALLDAYLALTEGLAHTFNPNIPSYVFEGLVAEENEGKKDPIFNYFFFGGSLYERYGVKTMVDAFHKTNITSKLVIAGSGPLDKYIEKMAEEDYRILYLSQLNKERLIAYLRNSIANINPRPLNPELDKESVPSKLLEYLSIGTPVISTKYPKFYSLFKDDVSWIEGNDFESMKLAFESYNVNKQEEYLKKAATARRKVFEFYGLKVQSESITHFLAQINSSNN